MSEELLSAAVPQSVTSTAKLFGQISQLIYQARALVTAQQKVLPEMLRDDILDDISTVSTLNDVLEERLQQIDDSFEQFRHRVSWDEDDAA
jgi:hypothetical protein